MRCSRSVSSAKSALVTFCSATFSGEQQLPVGVEAAVLNLRRRVSRCARVQVDGRCQLVSDDEQTSIGRSQDACRRPNRYAVPEAESHREVVVMRVSGLVDVHLDSPTSQKEWQFRRR